MDKTNIINTFTEVVDQLRNTECSQKEKIACFQRVAECIITPAMSAHINYATFCSKAVNILLLFCEDLDSMVRISAEENLNKIFRVMEKSRIHRILMDLYGEIKRNGNQRSLRICLRIFGYYAPQIRESNIRWYAQNLLPCMKVISKRKETLLQETLSEFVIKFGKHIQQGLTDSETCKLFEVFIENIGSDCAVKRRCTAQNCINLIEFACNKTLMAKYALNKVIEILLTDHQTNTVVGILGFLRQLVAIVIKNFTVHQNDGDDTFSHHKNLKSNNSEETRQLLEIYDYCLYLVASTPTTQHSILNAALDVIHSILQSLDGLSASDTTNNPYIGPFLLELLNAPNLKHVSYLKNKNTLKHQIFTIEMLDTNEQQKDNATQQHKLSNVIEQQLQQGQKHEEPTRIKMMMTSGTSMIQQQSRQQKRHTARSISECVDIDYVDEGAVPQNNENEDNDEDDDDDGDFTTLSDGMTASTKYRDNNDFTTKTPSSVINETISGHVVGGGLELRFQGGDSQNLLVNISSDDEKSIQLCHTDNESVNSIEFKAGISRGLVVDGVHSDSIVVDDVSHGTAAENVGTSQSTTNTSDAVAGGSDGAFTTFFNNINAASESVTKLFRTSSTSSKTAATPSNTSDSISMVSDVSALKRIETEVEIIEDSSPESSKTFPTPSTAVLGEIRSLDSVDVQSTSDVKPMGIDTPKRENKNPFMKIDPPVVDNGATSQLQLPVGIGGMFDQTLVYYTARLISVRFLLTGRRGNLYNDSSVRVSIKNISLNVISQCVRLSPGVLEISLKFMETEKTLPISLEKTTSDQGRYSPIPIPSDSSSCIDQEYEHLEVSGTTGEVISEGRRKLSFTQVDVLRQDDSTEEPLMEIIDDHFGKSYNDFNFASNNTATTMTRSADPVLIRKSDETATNSPIMTVKNEKLYTSEIISKDVKLRDFVEIHKAEEDMPPEMDAPPKPPKRTKTFRKPKAKEVINTEVNAAGNGIQYLFEILLFYNHEDPILRAGIQSIIGHYCRATQTGLVWETKINLQYLLAILCEGLQDDIHTVVIQALNTFDKIFPYVLFKYMSTPSAAAKSSPFGSPSPSQSSLKYHKSCCCRQCKQSCNNKNIPQQEIHSCKEEKDTCKTDSIDTQLNSTTANGLHPKFILGQFNDNDGIIAAILKDFQFQAKRNNSNDSCQPTETNNPILVGHCASCPVYHSPHALYATEACSCQTSCRCDNVLLFISPKLLLNKLCLCHYNKYWLVQNKYAEVISNLSYAALRCYYGNIYTINNNHRQHCCCCCHSSKVCGNEGLLNSVHLEEDDVDGNDYVCGLENSFIDELLQLIADDDVRVRECAAKCLCRFILQAAKSSYIQQEEEQKTFAQHDDDDNISRTIFGENIKMLQNFFEYSVFNDMSPTLRYILNPQQQRHYLMDQDVILNLYNKKRNSFTSDGSGNNEVEVVLSKVLYSLTNKIMTLKHKNVQFGVIFCIRELLKYYPYAEYASAWSEFNFMEIVVKLSQFNYNTAVDLTCQSDLMDVSSKLIVGCAIFSPEYFKENHDNTLGLLRHTMKIVNIYYHIFTNQKPLIMAKSQKVEIFGNAKEVAGTTQCLGYFGNEYIYLRLYQMLKSAYDNYKITINEEAGSKLISLLKTCLNSLSVCIEMLPHETAAGGFTGIGKSATDVTTATATASASSSSSLPASNAAGLSVAVGPEFGISVLKLIEETLQYLTKVINYAPEESIACLRQLLKYLFARNYGNRQQQQMQMQMQMQMQQQHHSEYSKQCYYPAFIKSYITAKRKELHGTSSLSSHTKDTTDDAGATLQRQTNNRPSSSSSAFAVNQQASVMDVNYGSANGKGALPSKFSAIGVTQDDYPLLAELFSSCLEYNTWKSRYEIELSKHIKLFEPLVMHCLTLFLKCNGLLQANILDLLATLLDFNVTYSILDSKNIIFDHITKTLENIESGIARNGLFIITPMIKFLIKLSGKNERNLISIPKIISIINNLLANYNIRDIAIQALKTLTFEIFLMNSMTKPPVDTAASILESVVKGAKIQKSFKDEPNSLVSLTEKNSTSNNELDTQKEVILGMLDKFIESTECQQVLSLLMLIEQLQQYRLSTIDANIDIGSRDNYNTCMSDTKDTNDVTLAKGTQSLTTCLPNPDTVCNMICNSICSNRLCIQEWNSYSTVDTFFKNNTKYLLGNSKEFMALLKYIIEGDVANFSDLSYATIILSNVILKTEEIYLVNHIKLYLKNHPTTVEKLEQKLQQNWRIKQNVKQQPQTPYVKSQQQQQQQRWLFNANSDRPSTSKAAARSAAFGAFDSSSSSGSASASVSALNEYNYFPTVLCDILFGCLQTLADHRRNSSVYSHQYATEYCRLVCNFVRVLNKLCFNTRLEDMPLVATIRSILNASESKLLNEYYNLLMMYSTQGCPNNTSNATTLTTGISCSGVSSATGSCATATSSGLPSSSASSLAEYVDDSGVLQLQLEMFKLLNSVGVLDTLTLLQHLQSNHISNHVRRALLNTLCHQSMPYTVEWNLQQVQHLFDASFLNILIVDQFIFLCNLCEVDEEFCSLFQATIISNIQILNKHSIINLLRLVEYLCKRTENCSIVRFAKFLQILSKLHKFVSESSSSSLTTRIKGPLQLQIERLVRHLIVNSFDDYDKNAIHDTFVHLIEEDEEQQQQQQMSSATKDRTASVSSYFSENLQFMILNDLEKTCETRDDDDGRSGPQGCATNIIDEKWIFNQLIKFSTQNNYDPVQIVKILVEIQSENKLQKIFNNGNFDATRILKHTISHSLQAMLQTFRNNCIQYNPHIHYMRPNPLVRVSLLQLMTRIEDVMTMAKAKAKAMAMPMMYQNYAAGTFATHTERGADDIKATDTKDINDATFRDAPSAPDAIIGDADADVRRQRCHCPLYLPMHLCGAVITLMENIKQIEVTALIYIESKFIDKFLSEHLLRPEYIVTLVRFIGHCCQWLVSCLGTDNRSLLLHSAEHRNSVTMTLHCLHTMLNQKFIWNALNRQSLGHKVTGGTTNTNMGATATGASGGIVDVPALTKCELNTIICSLLDVVSLAGSLLLENTLFYKKYKNALSSASSTTSNAASTVSLATSPASSSTAPINEQQQTHRYLQPHICDDNEGGSVGDGDGVACLNNVAWLTAKYNSIAIFLGKLIETKIGNYDKGIYFGEYYNNSTYSALSCAPESISGSDVQDLKGINNQFDFIPLNVLIAIGISTLRTNLFYAMAVTPMEIMQHLQSSHSASTSPMTSPRHKSQINSMLPIIPIESLSDVDILKSFVKRLSIFGFTTRQQFEEYFMTFLLLINKVYDENMVDQQEQYQIRSTCLEAIMELLITYKTFPIVGNKLSLYHHTTRWNRINCDSISLKKLHEIQLIISPSNVFYHSNLERNLLTDTVIGSQFYGANQFDVNFMWQQMENSSMPQQPSVDDLDSVQDMDSSSKSSVHQTAKHLSGIAAKTAFSNYQYFTRKSGVDFKSSSQLIFDVLLQMIEQNHILILPNLVKFTEICENREQIKQIWEKADYLKSHIPMDDTISHQHLIYLLCKTKGMLIPSHLEMLNLESLIKNYLKSSHLFVRCAALNGLLSLLESYAKTSTTIGKLSDDLVRLKDIILAYIDKHGLIEESPLQCSDLHTKLIWTLNYSLMEWTSKLDPHCNVAYHTKLTVNRLLKKSTNEQVYLCILHGLERMIVLDNKVSNISSHIGNAGGDSQNQMLRPSIEKLALELAKMENEKFSIPALKLLLSCIYVGSSKQLENTELSNGIVQDDPEIIAQQTDKVDILLQCIKSANDEAAWIYGQVLCQMIRDLVPPKEILTKVIKEFLAINQPHSDVIAMIVFQVFRSAIDSSFLQQLQDWLTCSLPTFLSLPQQKAVWCLSVVFLSASINLHLMKLFPLLLSGVKAKTMTVNVSAATVATKAATISTAASSSPATTPTTSMSTTTPKRMSFTKVGHHEIALFVTSAQDFYAKLGAEQKLRFREAFKEFHHIKVYSKMLQSL